MIYIDIFYKVYFLYPNHSLLKFVEYIILLSLMNKNATFSRYRGNYISEIPGLNHKFLLWVYCPPKLRALVPEVVRLMQNHFWI